MIINILKDISWINDLEVYNHQILETHHKYLSEMKDWFNPTTYRSNPLGRLYPHLDPVINFRPEYKLIFSLSNYVPLFLIRELYKDRKDILIEDVGAGSGNLIYFLSKSGFMNFDTFDNFSECPKALFDDMMKLSGVRCAVNNLELNPVIIHNASSPRFCCIAPGMNDFAEHPYYGVKRCFSNAELICFYSNPQWERMANEILPPLGFTFLCRDTDNMGVAWCRNDKVEEFTKILEKWKV